MAVKTTINFDSVALVEGSWVFTWTNPGPVRVVVWGIVLEEDLTTGTYTYTGNLYSTPTVPPPLEVVNRTDKAPSEVNVATIALQWYASTGAVRYDIEFYNGSTWIAWSSVPHDETWLYVVGTPVLDDQAETQWRVVAVDADGRESDPLNFTYYVVRPPDVPTAPSVACVGGTLTVQ